MKKVKIFFGPSVARSAFLSSWLSDRGYSESWVTGIDDVELRRAWERLARESAPGLFFDYPIDVEQDLQAVDAFVAHVIKNGGEWYYAPRPNDYMEVTDAAMVGMSSACSLGLPSLKERVKPYAKRVINVLPPHWRKPVRNLALRLYRNSSVVVSNDGSSQDSRGGDKEHDLRPEVKVPASLRRFKFDWQNWQAPRDILKRDLLDRIATFFPQPSNIHVIVLNQCNLKCVMCPYHSPKYKPHQTSGYFDERKALTVETFKKVAEYAGAKKVGLQFGQIEEVLMHKQFFEFLDISKECGVPLVHVTTNGVLLDKTKAERLAASGVTSVMFSIDSVNPETYREIRGSDLSQLEENIKFFMPLAKRSGIIVTASFILQPQAITERDQFLKKWKALGIDQVTFYVLTESDLKTGEMIRTSKEMYDKGNRYPCASPWTQTVIFPEGEVSLCCKTMTDVGWRGVVSMGSIPKLSMEEVWDGERYRKVREELLDNNFNQFPVCVNCEIWSASTSLLEEGKDYRRTFNETMETYQFL
jgi:MoaA/NifB/PqqE/SkfB family radical SAM enzyme